MGHLCKTPAFLSVKKHVVDPEAAVRQGGGGGGEGSGDQVGRSREIDVNLDLVVLEGNEGQGETHVAAEPELKGNVQGGCESLINGLANHLVVAINVALGLGQLVPDVHPVAVVLVDLLAADLNGQVGQKSQAEVIDPGASGNDRDVDLEVDLVDQITIAGNGAGHTLAEVSRTVEGLLN